MDNKNSISKNFYLVEQLCLDTESLIGCLIADYFLIQRGKVPFASALFFILLNGMNDQIYKQNLLSKKRKQNKEGKVIMTKADKNFTNEINFQCEKTDHFDISSTPITDENFTNEINFQCEKTDHFDKSDIPEADQSFTNEINFQCEKTDHFDKSDMLEADQSFTNEINFQCEITDHFDKSDMPKADQSFINENNFQHKKAYYFDKQGITDTDENFINENNFRYEKTYYFDKTGLPIDECEVHSVHSECKKIIETCCLIEIPRGFKLTDCSPGMCFNLGGLSCVKNPIIQKVILPACECEHPKQCDVVAGYEIRAVGEVNFSVSLPICAINGFCFPTHSYTCCSSTVPVNEIISHTCCPKPCDCNRPCVDWTYAYFCATLVEEECGLYIRVKMGVALEYTGDCECDEE